MSKIGRELRKIHALLYDLPFGSIEIGDSGADSFRAAQSRSLRRRPGGALRDAWNRLDQRI